MIANLARAVVLATLVAASSGAQSILHSYSDPVQGFSANAGCVGDVDADGYDDFAVNSGHSAGVRVFSGATGALLHQFVELTLIGFGNSFDGAGDVDGDGHDDVIVGCADGIAVGAAILPSQSVRVYSGQTGATLHSIDFLPWGRFGHDVAGLGDVDGDGADDFCVSSPNENTPVVGAGRVRVYSGATGAVLATLSGASTGENFGQSIARAGDRDGNGVTDLLVATGLAGGTVKVISPVTGALLATFQGPTWSANAPPFVPYDKVIVTDAADVDNDGVLDFCASRPGDSSAGFNAGSVYVFSGATLNVIHTFLGQPCDYLGAQIDLGDYTGDGYADVIVGIQNDLGNPDETYVFSGATGERVIDSNPYLTDASTAACAGDVNGDGFMDVLIGNDPFGTAPGEVRVIGGGPSGGPAARSNVGTSGEDILTVNGSAGGSMRRVDVPVSAPFGIHIATPSASTAPAQFAIVAMLGFPAEHVSFSLGVVGDLAVPPAFSFPNHPALFNLADTTGTLNALLQATPTPWSVGGTTGVPFPLELTIQGIVLENSVTPRTTNAVLVRIR